MSDPWMPPLPVQKVPYLCTLGQHLFVSEDGTCIDCKAVMA